MSAIYFHTIDNDTYRISGRERAYMSTFLNRLTLGLFNFKYGSDNIKQLVPCDSWVHETNSDFEESFKLWYSNDSSAYLNINDEQISTFTFALNTAYAMGNDVIKLMARIHSQCEIHCYVKNEHIEWFLSIVKQGLDTKILRAEQGWEELLKIKTNGDLVLSYSVCERFPNRGYDIDDDEWYENMTYEDQWVHSFNKLEDGLEISPETFNYEYFYYRSKISYFDLDLT